MALGDETSSSQIYGSSLIIWALAVADPKAAASIERMSHERIPLLPFRERERKDERVESMH
jgi:hypothetical protein